MRGIQHHRPTGKSSSYRAFGFTLAFFTALGVVLPTFANGFDREDIVNAAKDLIGKDYLWGGASPETGFDCSGIVFYVFGQFGKKVQREAIGQYHESKSIQTQNDLKPGDLVFFAMKHPDVDHVGIYIGNRRFIHSGSKGVVEASLDWSDFKNTYVAGGTYF
jgi:cell wall-associated NlpC family hydrolase